MSAINLQVICDTIYSWIASMNLVNSQSIILEDPNVDRPKTPYVSFRFLTGPIKIGSRDNHSYDSNLDAMVVSGPRDMSMTIKAFGETSLQIMADLHSSLELNSVQQLFQAKNMSVRNVGSVQEISVELESGIEGRAQMDVVFGVSSIQVEDQGAIEIIQIVDAKVKDVTEAEVQNINETVTKP